MWKNFTPQKIRPPHYFQALMVMATLLQLIFKPARMVGPIWLGAVIFTAGFTIMLCAVRLFGRHQTPVRHSEQPAAVVTEGLYRFTRNPMYVGVLLFLIGIGITIGTWPFVIVPVAMFLILHFYFIPWEEKTMEKLFGEQYLAYKKRVRRWL